jgi:hypothetical protein
MYYILLLIIILSCSPNHNVNTVKQDVLADSSAAVGNEALNNSGQSEENNIAGTIGVISYKSEKEGKTQVIIMNEDGSILQKFMFPDFSTNANSLIKPFAFSPDNSLLVFKCTKKLAINMR